MNGKAPSAELFLSEVSRVHGRRRALSGVTFSARAGELVVILGANGAGKTTLVHMLSGLFPPSSGRIEMLGHDMGRAAIAALAGLGVVFQEQTLDLDLTARANLRFHARLHGLPPREAGPRIDGVLARFGLSDRADEPARALSGGNRRRLELGRALLHRPRVLVLDEATVGLDPATRQDLIDHVRDLCRKDGVLALWTTHLLDEAGAADRVLCLRDGLLVFDGTPGDVREHAQSDDLAAGLRTLVTGEGDLPGR